MACVHYLFCSCRIKVLSAHLDHYRAMEYSTRGDGSDSGPWKNGCRPGETSPALKGGLPLHEAKLRRIPLAGSGHHWWEGSRSASYSADTAHQARISGGCVVGGWNEVWQGETEEW